MKSKSAPPTPTAVRPQAMLRIIKSRRTVRRFQRKPVPAGALKRVLEAGNWAPFSAYAPQGRRLYALSGDEREAAAEIVKQCPAILKYFRIQYETAPYGHEQEWADKARDFGSTLGSAPVMIVTVVKVMRARFPMMHNMAAAWTATQNMMVQAAVEGLASGVVTFTTPQVQAALLQHLGLTPGEWIVANVLNVGYADEQPPAPPRPNDLIVMRGSRK